MNVRRYPRACQCTGPRHRNAPNPVQCLEVPKTLVVQAGLDVRVDLTPSGITRE